MYRMTRLKVSGFRRLCDLDLEMRPLMVLIGANGVGKTSLLDVLSLISASARGVLNRKVSDFGGISSLLSRVRTPAVVKSDPAHPSLLSISFETSGFSHESQKYRMDLEPRGIGYTISNESLSEIHPGKGIFEHIRSDGSHVLFSGGEMTGLSISDGRYAGESALSQASKIYAVPESLKRNLSNWLRYHDLDVSARSPIRLPQQMRPAEHPGESGEDIVPFLYYLRETNPTRFELIIDTVRAGFQDFDGLAFPPVAAGTLAMSWNDKKLSKPVYTHEMSEGTLRFLWLISLLQSPSLPMITMIDEPEVSLHPELLSLLAHSLREASDRTQIIVATHSDRLIRFLRPEEVVAMDVDDNGRATATWADSFDLSDWLNDYSLDEVWRMGRIGGRA